MALAGAPDYNLPNTSLADVTPTSTPTALGSLACGPGGGILVTMHQSSSGIVRVGGPDTDTTHGQPLTPGASYTWTVGNASALWHVIESGSPKLCVTAV